MDDAKTLIGLVVGAIGLIASCIGIYTFVSGRQTLKESLPGDITDSQPSPGSTSNDATNEPWADPTEPLISSTASFYLDWADRNLVSYSFEQGMVASSGVPADMSIRLCEYQSDGGAICDIQASEIWELGQVSLSKVHSTEGEKSGCSGGFSVGGGHCDINIGETYVVETYNGHLAKFRVSNYQLKDPGFEIAIEWVYQPNDRPDFAGP